MNTNFPVAQVFNLLYRRLSSLQFAALVVPASTNTSNQAELVFHDTVKAPVDISSGWFWLWVTLALILLAVGIFFLIRYLRKSANVPPLIPQIPPHDRARRALERALSLISDPKAFTVAVSDAIRVYLEERFNFHAPDRTTEEFLYELQGTNLLTPAQKESLAQFLSACDLVKFAKYEPTETELRDLHASALRLVNETEPPPFEIADEGGRNGNGGKSEKSVKREKDAEGHPSERESENVTCEDAKVVSAASPSALPPFRISRPPQ